MKLLSQLTLPPQLKSKPILEHFSSSLTSKSKWNSSTNLIISHPTLLLIESCTSMSLLKQIQAHMTKTSLITHTFPFSRVLTFCAVSDYGDIDHAYQLFTQFQEPNTYMWNTMIRGYGKAGRPVVGFSVFCEMISECVEMDSRSFVFALKVCEQKIGFLAGNSVHCVIWKMGFDCELLVLNGLIHFFNVFGCLEFSRKVFDEMPVRDVVSWTSMIDGYSKYNFYDEALKVFGSMLSSDVEPNEVTMIAVISACTQKGNLRLGRSIHEFVRRRKVNFSLNLTNALLDMYLKCGCFEMARQIFDNMRIKDVFSWTSMVNGYAKAGDLEFARKFFNEMPKKNVVSWNAMIAGYSQNNQPLEAISLFHDMVEEGLVPVENTLVCVLSACGQLSYLDFGNWIYGYYIATKRIQMSMIIANALIDMYAKCGAVDAAAKIFHDMPRKNLVTWNSMISAYATHGHPKTALILFKQMKNEGFMPDSVTFVGVLTACSHGGLITKGRKFFQSLKTEYGIDPKEEHYACMIDSLARVGFLEEAYKLITEMPMEPSEAAWGALLNACRKHGNVGMAELAAHKLLDLNPEDSGTYSLLATIYANEGKWNEARMVRCMMREKGVKKNSGRSLIKVEGEFHEFLAGDKSHPQSEGIDKALCELQLLSKMDSHVSNTLDLINPFLFSDEF